MLAFAYQLMKDPSLKLDFIPKETSDPPMKTSATTPSFHTIHWPHDHIFIHASYHIGPKQTKQD